MRTRKRKLNEKNARVEEVREKLSSYKKQFEEHFENYKNGDVELYEFLIDDIKELETEIEDIEDFALKSSLKNEAKTFLKQVEYILKKKRVIEEIADIRSNFYRVKKGVEENKEDLDYLNTASFRVEVLDEELFELRKVAVNGVDTFYDDLHSELKEYTLYLQTEMKILKNRKEQEPIYTPRPKTRKNRKTRKTRKHRRAF